jgi:hypothetical protein
MVVEEWIEGCRMVGCEGLGNGGNGRRERDGNAGFAQAEWHGS